MNSFVGRVRELGRLRRELDAVSSGEGRLLVLRGRRQTGKSTLVERFLSELRAPSVFFTAAARADPADERDAFVREVAGSSLEARELVAGASYDSWEAILRAIAASTTRPSVVVLDELPYLAAADPSLEGSLQRVWDRHLARTPLLLVLVGSDVSAMELLSTYGRPLYGRAREMVLDPLSVADTAQLLDLDPAAAFEAYVVTGGMPRLAAEMRGHPDPMSFVSAQLDDPTSPLVVLAERALAAELPSSLQARDVLATIGRESVSFSRLADRSGLAQASLARALRLLRDTRLVTAESPLSATRSKSAMYRVADPYLAFWLGFVGPSMDRILRGRGDAVASAIRSRWQQYVGTAVEPLVRTALERTLPHPALGDGSAVGRYWSRDHQVEVDLVVADSPDAPARVDAVGSVKWRTTRPFGRDDLADLHAARSHVPGAAQARTIAVARSGVDVSDIDLPLTAADLLAS